MSIPLIDAFIRYNLQGEKISVVLQGIDLLNRDANFQRISEANYLLQRERETIGRYAMLTFNLRIGR